MTSATTIINSDIQPVLRPENQPGLAQEQWFAIHTYSKHEKRVASELLGKGLEVYLPLVARRHQWSDRTKTVTLPLFPCYAFARFGPSSEMRVKVLQTSGVIGLVGSTKPIPVPDDEIENVRILLAGRVEMDPYHFLKIGERIRVRGGSLDGLEGILVERKGNRRLVISVESLQRSLSISIEGLDVEQA